MPVDHQDLPAEARDLIDFIERSPTPYHAVAEVAARLERAGFRRFLEQDPFTVEATTRGYVVRGGSVVAFALGSVAPEEGGFIMAGAHTDSPNLRLKPRPDLEANGFRQLMVEVYGGVLLGTWLDRDLGIAGRVALADGSHALVHLSEPICRIPNLAIHLNREVNKEGLQLNPQLHLNPVLGLELGGSRPILERIAASLAGGPASGARASDILGFDLCLFDVQPPAVGGDASEFLFSARLDNLASCHAALAALLGLRGDFTATRVIALYDHEEVGSQSATGARSQLLESVLERLALGYPGATPASSHRAFARSLLVSADMAHGVHPNYADKHDRQHRPLLGGGPVIKVNANQSYATDGLGVADFTRACRASGFEPQHFVARNDMPCGSTIGPITAARLGVRTVDVGNPMLSMHSCREMAAVSDVAPMIRALASVFARQP